MPINKGSVLQDWVTAELTFMMQTVVICALRGPDGAEKYHQCKWLVRWFRRCVVKSALDGCVFTDPETPGGGSYNGPSISPTDNGIYGWEEGTLWEPKMEKRIDQYISAVDDIPMHFQLHFLHAIEIVGYFHPDERIRSWWEALYKRIVNSYHLNPETKEQLALRLGDNRETWLQVTDSAVQQ